MSGWPTVRLEDCAEIVSGATPSTSESAYWDGDVCWATPKDLSELEGAYISDTPRKITRTGLQSCAATVLPTDSVLFSSRAPIGHVAINTVPMATNQGFKSFVPNRERVHAKFLYHWLRRNRPYLESLGNGATFKEVSKAVVARIEIPLPPLPEQRRIAEILDKADALRAKRRAALAQLDTLTQFIFLDMFGDPATNPKGWPVKRIEDITECLDRLRRPVTESDRKPGNVPYYGANGQQGWIDTALFKEPLVLVAEDGGYFDAPERGVAYRIDGPAWVNNHAHILRAIPRHVDTEFLHRALRHFNFLPFISGTTRAKLTQGQLNAVKLFAPPLDLQRQFGKRVASVQRIVQVTVSSADQFEELFAALQQRAFRGEL
jgi:type I restriction enzyme S subunit